MFGDNPVRPQELDEHGSLRVQEVFDTVQGEGPLAGVPALFIRLAGCNLRCYFCDTEFESNYDKEPVSIVNLMARTNDAGRDLVVLTGGEPLRQNVEPLVKHLVLMQRHVQIETAGTLWVKGLERYLAPLMAPGLSIVVSPKTPSVHPMVKQHAIAWKYIIGATDVDEHDGLPTSSTQFENHDARIARPPAHIKRHQVYLQPCDDVMRLTNTMSCIGLAQKHGYRLCLQQHKYLNLP